MTFGYHLATLSLAKSKVSGWHALETRGTSVEGRGVEVDLCFDHTLFTNVPETCHPFFKVCQRSKKVNGVACHPIRTCVGFRSRQPNMGYGQYRTRSRRDSEHSKWPSRLEGLATESQLAFRAPGLARHVESSPARLPARSSQTGCKPCSLPEGVTAGASSLGCSLSLPPSGLPRFAMPRRAELVSPSGNSKPQATMSPRFHVPPTQHIRFPEDIRGDRRTMPPSSRP